MSKGMWPWPSIKVKLPRGSAILGSSIILQASISMSSSILFPDGLIEFCLIDSSTNTGRLAGGKTLQLLAAPTHPTVQAARVADNNGEFRHVSSHDGASAHQRPRADGTSR